jgi:hypothetical protein
MTFPHTTSVHTDSRQSRLARARVSPYALDVLGSPPDADDDVRTESQKEWADWAEHGYRKRYQPRSMLAAGGVAIVVLIAALITLTWLVGHGRVP